MGVKGLFFGSFFLFGVLGAGGYFFYQHQEEERVKEEKIRNTAATKDLLRDLQEEIDDYFKKNRSYPSKLESDINSDSRDSWGNKLNYKKTTYSDLRRIDGKLTIFENIPHYELSSNGHDGIPETSDDINVWYKKGHEWGSTSRLNAIFESDLAEAKKTPLDKTFEKGEKLLDRLKSLKDFR